MLLKEFNDTIKVGDTVLYKDDFGDIQEDVVNHEATTLGSGQPVMWLTKKGSYDLKRCIGKKEMPKWAYSLNQENYDGPYDTREEAIEAAKEDIKEGGPYGEYYNAEVFSIGEIVYPKVEGYFDVDRFVEDAEENMTDNEFGFVDDDHLIDISDKKQFAEALTEVIKEFCSTRYWTVQKIEEVHI